MEHLNVLTISPFKEVRNISSAHCMLFHSCTNVLSGAFVPVSRFDIYIKVRIEDQLPMKKE